MKMIQCDGCGTVDTQSANKEKRYRSYNIDNIEYDMCPKCKRLIGEVMTAALHNIVNDIRSEHGLPNLKAT